MLRSQAVNPLRTRGRPLGDSRDGKEATVAVIDLAGGEGGGAGRFRAQYLRYADEHRLPASAAIGLEEHVTPLWLVRREIVARGCGKAVAANNVSFLVAGEPRWTLLRNANQFLSAQEWVASETHFPSAFSTQARTVRLAARRSDVVVVPSSSMAERVATTLPRLSDRIVVRHHPLRVPARQTDHGSSRTTIICPIVNAPYKRLLGHLELLQSALGGRLVRVVTTMRAKETSAALRADPRFSFVGLLSRRALRTEYDAATAVYYPTTIESFGYPLAEARAAGMPVIAQEIAHNREIAGAALFGYRSGSASDLGEAVTGALHARLTPDPGPFDPDSYFDWLLT